MENTVTLIFQSVDEKRYFMRQLVGGYGKDHVFLAWQGDFDNADSFKVTNLDDEEEYYGSD